MDEAYLAAALRYVSLNPVRARLVKRARDWRWASTRAHLASKDDGVTTLAPIRARFPRFADLLDDESTADLFDRLRSAESIGRPLGGDDFLARIEWLAGRRLRWASADRSPKPQPGRVKCTVTGTRKIPQFRSSPRK
jgi:putative transposase